MRAFIMSVVLWLCLPLAAVADAKEIQSVIDRQLEAFQADDFYQDRPLSQATPGFRFSWQAFHSRLMLATYSPTANLSFVPTLSPGTKAAGTSRIVFVA